MDFYGCESYIADANQAVEFKLFRHKEDILKLDNGFAPEMSHQIFGQNETIFGYENLQVQILYIAGPLNMHIKLIYTKKMDKLCDDIVGAIEKQLPENCLIEDYKDFLKTAEKSKGFQPFGDKIAEYTPFKSSRLFEIYVCDKKSSEQFLNYFQRLETFSLWFIDAASYIDTDDPNWKYFVVYEKFKNTDGKVEFATIGYCTVYEYYAYPDKKRPRISQLLILPPFQKLGIATAVIENIYSYYKKIPVVLDITVESPSDDFQRLRNFVDLCNCIKLPSFSEKKLKLGFNREMIKEAQEIAKVNSKQARIIYEILRLYYTDINNTTEYNRYCKIVKKRLNSTYIQQLKQVEKLERANFNTTMLRANLLKEHEREEQLQKEYDETEEKYRRVICRLEHAVKLNVDRK